MTSRTILLYHGTPKLSDVRVAQLSHVLGVICKLVDASAVMREFGRTPDHSLCVLASANTMCHLSTGSPIMECLLRKARFLFTYGFTPERTHASLAHFLTEGLITHLCSFSHNNLQYRVASSHPDITQELSGLSFGPIN